MKKCQLCHKEIDKEGLGKDSYSYCLTLCLGCISGPLQTVDRELLYDCLRIIESVRVDLPKDYTFQPVMKKTMMKLRRILK
jgi:hypothetical protein